MGPYIEGKTRLVKLRLKSQKVTEEMRYRTTKLREVEECKEIYINKNKNEKERKKWNELLAEAKERNNVRSDKEKELFFWRVLGDRVRKWYIREKMKESES